jgi:hypothetical protein
VGELDILQRAIDQITKPRFVPQRDIQAWEILSAFQNTGAILSNITFESQGKLENLARNLSHT